MVCKHVQLQGYHDRHHSRAADYNSPGSQTLVEDRVVAAEHDGKVDPALREEGGVVVVENEAWC